MSKEQKPKNTKFNAYWIYGTASRSCILGYSTCVFWWLRELLQENPTTPSQFFEYLRRWRCKKSRDRQHKREALVYLTTQATN